MGRAPFSRVAPRGRGGGLRYTMDGYGRWRTTSLYGQGYETDRGPPDTDWSRE